MTNVSPDNTEPRDALYCAQRTSSLQVSTVPTGAVNLNINGRQVVGPLQGFGQLSQKTYRLRLPTVKLTPLEVMQIKRWPVSARDQFH